MVGTNSDIDPQPGQSLSLPLLSFVLPVHNAAKYLTECLDGITQQPFRDIEIIAVDGASTDGSAEILIERQRTEPRLKVIHERPDVGPGEARNVGARQARGEYLWFVDADDIVAAECLTPIVHNLKVASPDILLVGYELLHPSGWVETGPVGKLSNAVNSTCFTLAEYPEALVVSLASWNKIVSRSFYESSGVEFSKEWPHEDVQVSCRLMLSATKLSILDQICYSYRKDRPGASMVSGKRKRHFRVFEVWREVLGDARTSAEPQHPHVTADVYRALFERAIGHCASQLETGGWGIGRLGVDGYIARQDRRDFFDQMHKQFMQFVPSDYVRPARLVGIKYDRIQRGEFWQYSLLDSLNKLRNAIRRFPRSARARFGRLTQQS